MKLKYISAPAGSGKTTQAIAYSKYLNSLGLNVLFVVPTIKLADQIASKSHIQALHSDNHHNVASVIFKTINDSNDIVSLVITEESFKRINIINNRAEWVVIKDEAHEPLSISEVSLIDSYDVFAKHFDCVETNNSSLVRLVAKPNNLTEYDDFIYGNLKTLIDIVDNNNFEVLADPQYLTYIKPTLVHSIFEKPSLYAGFADVIFMSANFEHTFLYHQWASVGVDWINITKQFNLPSVIPNTQRVSIHYYTESEYGWSKTSRDHSLQSYAKWINYKLKDLDFIYVTNNSDAKSINLNGTAMPAVCHGMNNYSKATRFVSTASYLINKKYNAFYDHYNTSISDARSLRNSQMLFQQLMRCDLRNYNSTKPISLYVPTQVEAIELLQYLPEATIVDFDKSTPGSVTDLSAQLHASWVNQLNIASLTTSTPECIGFTYNYNLTNTTVKISHTQVPHDNIAILSPMTCVDLNDNNEPMQLLLSKKQRYEEKHLIYKAIKMMQQHTSISVSDVSTKDKITELKNKNTWFSNAIIDEKKSFNNNNVNGVYNFLVFDFDNSSLSLATLKKAIFPGLEFLHYTSISNGQEWKKGACFRVVVPCSRNMTVKEHAQLTELFEQRAIKADSINHGFDAVSKKVVQKWFFPHKESVITHVTTKSGAKQAIKSMLDVDQYISQVPKTAHVQTPTYFDLVITNKHTQQIVEMSDYAYDMIEKVFNELTPGNRSHNACRIGGYLNKFIRDSSIKNDYLRRLKLVGVDDAAIKSAKKYAFK